MRLPLPHILTAVDTLLLFRMDEGVGGPYRPVHDRFDWFDMDGDNDLHAKYSPEPWNLSNNYEILPLQSDSLAGAAALTQSNACLNLLYTTPIPNTDSAFTDVWSSDGLEDRHEPQSMNLEVNGAQVSLNDFFIQNGARLSPTPCTHCSRYRLQCLILQTTYANPNPVSSCSSCVALFRECSLARGEKRQAAQFETSAPVIGQLHGVNEEDDSLGKLREPDMSAGSGQELMIDGNGLKSLPVNNSKQRISRIHGQTKPLRQWLSTHQDNPYPTEEEKDRLTELSGLKRTQVVNWFTNARRRQRQSARALSGRKIFLVGSPMPRLPSSPSPLERWKNSPPEEEHVSPAAIRAALSSGSDWYESFNSNIGGHHASSESGNSSHPGSTSCAESTVFWTSSASDSSWQSHRSTEIEPYFHTSRRGFKKAAKASRQATGNVESCIYQCTFCQKEFRKRHDWLRHERSIHMPRDSAYICESPSMRSSDRNSRVWRLNNPEPECALCGYPSPDEAHFLSHEFSTCSERSLSERSFARRDHFWQHLYKFHGCRKWKGWTLNLDLWRCRNDQVRSRCGFCDLQLWTWTERADHLVQHFKAGLMMEQWVGRFGLIEPQVGLDQRMLQLMPLSTDLMNFNSALAC